jgi:2-hydroxychromene-2-carboxylate isomerase
MRTLEFWFEFASTYSYPAAMRIGRLATAAGVEVEWKSFLLGPIFRAQGWNDSPFNLFAAKGRYMWRDLERICGREGLPFRRPSRFPRNGLLAARVACLPGSEGWRGEFVRRVYHSNFVEDAEISEPAVLGQILEGIGQDRRQVLERAQSPSNKESLHRRTEEAARLGLFGAPSFVAAGELFWGNDRLEQAIEWATRAPAGVRWTS